MSSGPARKTPAQSVVLLWDSITGGSRISVGSGPAPCRVM